MTSAISSLRRMLLNWQTPPENTRAVIETLLAALARLDADIYTVARIIARSPWLMSTTTAIAPSGSA